MYASLVEDIYAINEVILKFSEHLKSVYELEMFYGDDTLSSLMKHAKEIVQKVEELDLITENDENSEKEAQEDQE